MKLHLIKLITTYTFLFFNTSLASEFEVNYNVSSSGIKIGEFNWFLNLNENNYTTKIDLKNSGLFSTLYKFKGGYTSIGIIENQMFKSKKYSQNWQTKKQTKIIKISFDDSVTNLSQNPKEKELSRIDLDKLFEYFDPITSFLNILSGFDNVKTIDGRRIYIMKKKKLLEDNKITIEIRNYKNIWADHNRNDLKKIEFFIKKDVFFPEKMNIYFKERVFKLQKI
tara:strand:+ start:480 stop:1151 length:672 start_codon:yes stop_codon:yes gene_type:complete